MLTRGGIVTFRITIANLGNSLASGVFAILPLPVGMTRVAIGSTPGWTIVGPRRFQLNLGTLAPGQRRTLIFKARIAATARPGASLAATAAVGLDALNGPDANLADNSCRSLVRVL
jgi:uncharacterized repeat protein (TIGR01451 family)